MVLSDIDRTLLTRCLNRAEGAWEDFVDRYIALITHVVQSALQVRAPQAPPNWRDDLVAEVFLELIEQDFAILRRFRGQSSLGTYLVVVARRIAVSKIIKLRKLPLTASSLVEATAAEENQMRIDDSEEVVTLLSRLPDQEATALRMFHLEHRSYRDIGSHFGIPENSVGPLLSQARERMRGMRS